MLTILKRLVRFKDSEYVRFSSTIGFFFLANGLLFFTLCLGFVLPLAEGSGPESEMFPLLAVAGQAWVVFFSSYTIVSIIGIFPAARKLISSFFAFAAALVHAFILMDLRIWQVFRFHVNGLVLNVVTTPGGLESFKVNPFELIGIAGFFVILLSIELIVIRRILNLDPKTPPIRGPIWSRFRRAVVLAGFLAAVAERSVYAVADLSNDVPVLVAARQVPFYQPTTLKKIASKFGISVSPRSMPPVRNAKSAASLTYPLVVPRVPPVTSGSPNFLWIVLDCLRYDALTEKSAPRISDFSKDALVFDHHISSGNNTRMGIFGMFYGLSGTYWQPILAQRRPPALLTALGDAGYQFYISASAPLTFPEFRHTAFVEIEDSVADDLPGRNSGEKDLVLTKAFNRFLASEAKSKPFFSMLLFDSTHSPYSFTPDHGVFLPWKPERYYAGPTEHAELAIVKNRYLNAIHYADSLVGSIIDKLRAEGLLENTLILITGDHGEEFYEHGNFGHFTSFSPEQTHVPMVMRVPGRASEHIERLTSHLDLVPTMFDSLRALGDPAQYSLGYSMLNEAQDRKYAQSCGWDQCAIKDAAGTVVFGTEPYNAAIFESFDQDYRALPAGADPSPVRRGAIVDVINKNRLFAK
jgi:membrane-anchored protein YejM (alkaline phosphatase superfamily)